MKKLLAFIHGVIEFRSSVTANYDIRLPDGSTDDSIQYAYDLGRDWAHCLTLRFFEEA